MRLGLGLGLDTQRNTQSVLWDGSQSGILDIYPGATLAFSFRALNSAYTGPVIRVTRSSDNSEQDIYALANGDLDTASLLAFVGAGDGHFIFYDQSGNNEDSSALLDSNQPRIVISGNLVTENSLPAGDFNGTSHYLIHPTVTKESMFYVCGDVQRRASAQRILFQPASDASNGFTRGGDLIFTTSGSDVYLFSRTGDTTYNITQTAFPSTSMLFSVTDNASQTYPNGYFNGGLVINSSSAGAGTTSATNGIIGARAEGDGASSDQYFQGKIQELIFYNSDQSSNRSAIDNLIYNYYIDYDNMESETQAILDYADSQGYQKPSIDVAIALNTAIASLKSDGIWDELDILYILATNGDSDFAKINIKNPGTFDCVEIGSPTFTANQGFLASSGNCLNTQFTPLTDGVNHVSDDNSHFTWLYSTPTGASSKYAFASRHSSTNDIHGLRAIDSSTRQHGFNQGSGIFDSTPESGLIHSIRTSTTQLNQISNGIQTTQSSSATSGTLSNRTMYIGAMNAGSVSNPVDTIISIAGLGSSLFAKRVELHNAFNTYMSSL